MQQRRVAGRFDAVKHLESKRLKVLQVGRGEVESALLMIDCRQMSEFNSIAGGVRRP